MAALIPSVALRKESVDRNCPAWQGIRCLRVALRKESVDRNYNGPYSGARALRSLSARRAWIEIGNVVVTAIPHVVALRKESVDRNARGMEPHVDRQRVALRKESVDRNRTMPVYTLVTPVALRKESVDRNCGF